MTSLSFFAFRQPQKGGFARAVKDKGGLSVYCFISYARKILLHRITRHICPDQDAYGGYFFLRYFPVLDGAGKNPQQPFAERKKVKVSKQKSYYLYNLLFTNARGYVIIKMYYHKIGEVYAGRERTTPETIEDMGNLAPGNGRGASHEFRRAA